MHIRYSLSNLLPAESIYSSTCLSANHIHIYSAFTGGLTVSVLCISTLWVFRCQNMLIDCMYCTHNNKTNTSRQRQNQSISLKGSDLQSQIHLCQTSLNTDEDVQTRGALAHQSSHLFGCLESELVMLIC